MAAATAYVLVTGAACIYGKEEWCSQYAVCSADKVKKKRLRRAFYTFFLFTVLVVGLSGAFKDLTSMTDCLEKLLPAKA